MFFMYLSSCETSKKANTVGSEHVTMFPIQCHFRLANQKQSCLWAVENSKWSFHFTRQVEHDDISSVCSLSHMSVHGESGWVLCLWFQLLSVRVFAFQIFTDYTELYRNELTINMLCLLFHFSSADWSEIVLICSSWQWFYIT